MRRDDVKMGMSATVGGEEQIRRGERTDNGLLVTGRSVGKKVCWVAESSDLDCACTNSFVFRSARIFVTQQDVFFSVVTLELVGSSEHIPHAPPPIIAAIGHVAITTGMPMLKSANTPTSAHATTRYLKQLFIWL